MKHNIKLLRQPNGFSCGNTCIKMILDYLEIYQDVSIKDIINICGSNSKFGTRHTEMMVGLDFFKIPYKRNDITILDSDIQIKTLNNILDNGNIFLLRTLLSGVKHWMIVIGKDENNNFIINDPWSGSKLYNDTEIIKIWKPRDYDGFEIILPLTQ
jgi:ABC-type bacteriocin/lantibiotic exporter with double-glycine peptidase domain